MSVSTADPFRLNQLNSLRAVAAIMLCLYHTAFLLGDELPDAVQILDWGQEGVYVFFVISGLVMPLALDKMNYRHRDFAKFMIKRIIRLQPPLILSAIVMTCLSYHKLKETGCSLITLFIGSASLTAPILGIPFVNDIYWPLFIEMQFYLFIAFLFPILVTRKAGGRWVFILILLVTSFISLAFDDKWIKLSLPFHIPVFLMGYFLFLRKTCRINPGEFFLGITICTVCCAMLTGYYHELGYRISIVAGLTSIIIAYSKEGLQWLNSIGQYSYSLYLFHWLFISPMAHYVRPYFQGFFGAIELYVLVILLCVGGSRLFYIIIEKHSLAWAKKFGGKKTIAN
jgi:peptidoglycan/LPS O-acetylase OafA/YrhL